MKHLIQAFSLAFLLSASAAQAAEIESAVTSGNLALTEQLLANGADVNYKGAMLGLRPLHYAVMASNKAMIELLLAKGADINIKKNDGYTPLHLAAGRGNVAMVEFLLAKGATANLTNNAGETPLALAKDDQIRQLLAGK